MLESSPSRLRDSYGKPGGERLSDIWHVVDAAEQACVKRKCTKALQALRGISIRLDDPGKHNILYARKSRTVTLLELEVVAPLAGNTSILIPYEMGIIFM